ncbi:MAG: GspE/PulE family protein [Calditrichia bacterium]
MNSNKILKSDSEIRIESDVVGLLSEKQARYYRVVPIKWLEKKLHLACEQPPELNERAELRFLTGCQIDFSKYSVSEIEVALNHAYQANRPPSRDKQFNIARSKGNYQKQPEHGDVVSYVDWLIRSAIEAGASDIHVEIDEEVFRIRLRLDGKLVEFDNPDCRPQSVISRLKIMSGLDIAEKRRPQDGRIRFEAGPRAVDIRVSTLPTDFGEKVVMRILDKSALNLSLESLQMQSALLNELQQILKMPHGMILVTGPTGSGKTTTLYSALNYLNRTESNIITIEDPIEYNLQGVNQTMVRADIGLTFASVLRSVLRQDPNIIMLGEIRDAETAEIAVRSALTGHLVLSTLHTNDAASTIVRLIDMGIEPFLVAGAVRMILAQRLVRKICSACREPDFAAKSALSASLLSSLPSGITLFRGRGCNSCYHTGYSGRIAIFEPFIMTEALGDLILNGGGLTELRNTLREQNSVNLRQSGLRHVAAGITTLEEVLTETV